MRRILHVDMDAFYASVEQRDDPSLRGKPVAVGGPPDGRGVVRAASYEARAVRRAVGDPDVARGQALPDLVIVPPDFREYRAASSDVFGCSARSRRWWSRCRWTRPTSTSPRMRGARRWDSASRSG